MTGDGGDMFCPRCGAQNSDQARFCGKCGHELQGYAAYAGPAEDASRNAGGPAARGVAVKRLLPMVVVVAVVVVAVYCVSQLFSGGAHASAESLSNALEEPTEAVFRDIDSDDASERFGETVLELLPPGVMDAYERQGFDRSDAINTMVSSVSTLQGYSSVFDKLDFEIDYFEGKSLDDDFIDSVNDSLQNDLGLSMDVEAASAISARMTATAREDVGFYSAGESVTQELDASGLVAVEIDGKWYLWSGELNW